jgi:CBS domain-containing protein
MKVADVMTRDVKVADPNRSVRDASRLMAASEVGALPVGENDKLVGMITDRDIVIRVLGVDRDPATTTIRDAMSGKIEYCFEDDEAVDAATRMAALQVRRLAVLSRDKRLVGIVSIGDLALRASPATGGRAMEGVTKPSSRHAQ